jgi:hypothetical protein
MQLLIIFLKSSFLFLAFIFLESLMPSIKILLLFKITAAATIGPASAPLPTSNCLHIGKCLLTCSTLLFS